MAGNSKTRRPYRPKPVLAFAHENVIARAQPMSDDQLTDLGIAYQIALSELLTNPNAQDCYTVQSQLLIAAELCQRGYGDFTEVIEDGLAAIQRAIDRAARLGSYALDGDGIQAIKAAVRLSEIQFRVVAMGEVWKALQTVQSRVERMAA